MSERTIYITTASWEPRFLAGVERVLAQQKFSEVVCFWFKEFADRTSEARQAFQQMVAPLDPGFSELIMYSPESATGERRKPAYVSVWKEVNKLLGNLGGRFDSFVLDITTMPRETLWITLDLLSEARIPGTIVYHRAITHGEWCGTEPEPPHIVPKLGGLLALDRPTKLLIVSGYDEDRSEQFIAAYEPNESVILFQDFPDGSNTENRAKNEERHKARFGNRGKTVKLRGVNCYSPDWGFSQILDAAREYGHNANLVLASLGPKTSAVSLYRVHRDLPESSLIYAPCKNYNPEYSVGIGNSVSLDWRVDPSTAG